MEEPKLYTLDEVANIIKMGRRTLYTYIKDNQLKAIKVGRKWRVRHEDLQEFLLNGEK